MSGTGYQEALGYRSQKENESFHALGQIHNLPSGGDVQILDATGKIDISKGPRILLKSTGGAVSLTSTPHLDAPVGADAVLVLEGADAADKITISGESVLAGSGMKISGGAPFELGLGDTLELYYSSESGFWLEKSRAVNA